MQGLNPFEISHFLLH